MVTVETAVVEMSAFLFGQEITLIKNTNSSKWPDYPKEMIPRWKSKFRCLKMNSTIKTSNYLEWSSDLVTKMNRSLCTLTIFIEMPITMNSPLTILKQVN